MWLGMLGLRANFVEEALLEQYPAQMEPFRWTDGALDFCESTMRQPFEGCVSDNPGGPASAAIPIAAR